MSDLESASSSRNKLLGDQGMYVSKKNHRHGDKVILKFQKAIMSGRKKGVSLILIFHNGDVLYDWVIRDKDNVKHTKSYSFTSAGDGLKFEH